jgi:hypothetical protein
MDKFELDMSLNEVETTIMADMSYSDASTALTYASLSLSAMLQDYQTNVNENDHAAEQSQFIDSSCLEACISEGEASPHKVPYTLTQIIITIVSLPRVQ